MASLPVKKQFAVEAQEELICPLCYELFCGLCEPKELDCVHVFCQICLLRIVGMESAITCPECRHVTSLSVGGVSSLKTILRLRNLAEKYAKHCKDLPIQGAGSTPHVTPKDSNTCSKHQSEKMYFLCVTCNESICQFCLVRNHTPPAHEIQEVKTSREELEIELQHAISKSDDTKKRLEEQVGSIFDLVSTAESEVDRELAAIDKQIQDVITVVQENGEKLKTRLQIIANSQTADFNREKDCLNEKIRNIKITQATARKTRANLPDTVYTTRYSPVVKKLQLLSKDVNEAVVKGKPFIPKFIPNFTSKIILGKLEICLQTQPVNEFGEFQFARAIVPLRNDNGFVVADFYGRQIVFLEENGTYREHMTLELTNPKYGPTDVAVTSAGEFLLATWTGVERFSTNGLKKSRFAAKCDMKEGVYSVTTAPDDRVLIGNIETSSISIHTPDGELQQTLKVACHPYHISCNGTNVAISQEVTKAISVVCLDTGTELFREAVDGVHGLCYHVKSNCLLVGKTVSDGKSRDGSIEQYCADTGRWIGQLASRLYSPQAVALTDDDLLAVADRKNVQVFQIS